jgi:Uma2 family endonuclease
VTTVAHPAQVVSPHRFQNGVEWLRALGDVPLERVVFDPWPGTATEADLLRLVEGDRLCELIDHTLVEKPVGYWEALVASTIAKILGNYVDDRDLGAVSGPDSTMRMKSGNVRLPDVAFVSNDHLPKTMAPIPNLSPDLAIEVLSKSNTPAEMQQKLREYFHSGTRLAWFVELEARKVSVYRSPGAPTRVLDESGVLDGEDVVPGFSVPVADVFRKLPG